MKYIDVYRMQKKADWYNPVTWFNEEPQQEPVQDYIWQTTMRDPSALTEEDLSQLYRDGRRRGFYDPSTKEFRSYPYMEDPITQQRKRREQQRLDKMRQQHRQQFNEQQAEQEYETRSPLGELQGIENPEETQRYKQEQQKARDRDTVQQRQTLQNRVQAHLNRIRNARMKSGQPARPVPTPAPQQAPQSAVTPQQVERNQAYQRNLEAYRRLNYNTPADKQNPFDQSKDYIKEEQEQEAQRQREQQEAQAYTDKVEGTINQGSVINNGPENRSAVSSLVAQNIDKARERQAAAAAAEQEEIRRVSQPPGQADSEPANPRAVPQAPAGNASLPDPSKSQSRALVDAGKARFRGQGTANVQPGKSAAPSVPPNPQSPGAANTPPSANTQQAPTSPSSSTRGVGTGAAAAASVPMEAPTTQQNGQAQPRHPTQQPPATTPARTGITLVNGKAWEDKRHQGMVQSSPGVWVTPQAAQRIAANRKKQQPVASSRPASASPAVSAPPTYQPKGANGQPAKGTWKKVDGGWVFQKPGQNISTSPQGIAPKAPALARQLPRRGTSNAGYDNWRSGLAARRADFRKRRSV